MARRERRSSPGGEPTPLKPGAVAALPDVPQPDRSGFQRSGFGGSVGAAEMLLLASHVSGRIGEHTDPEAVPWAVLDAMGYDPWVFLGEQLFAAPIRDQTLYYVQHDDPRVAAEAEAWLFRPAFCSALLRYVTGAFSLGLSVWVCDWAVEDLTIQARTRTGGTRARTLREHQHYVAAHEIHPGEVDELRAESDRLVSVRYGSQTFRADRAFAHVWGERFGRWQGSSSRRRAWRAYYKSEFVDTWQGRWLERGVDPPRIAYAPDGRIELNGETLLATDVMAAAIKALRGGGVAVLPAKADNAGNQLWSVKAMELPDVSDVWHKALDQCAVAKLVASFVPPSSAGLDTASMAGARIPQDMLVEQLEYGAQSTADQLSAVLAVVHRVNHGTASPPPIVCAREIPRTKVKRLMDVLRAVVNTPRGIAGSDLQRRIADSVDVSILDELGIPRRAEDEVVGTPAGGGGGPPGRPREELGDRAERRENARTEAGEDAVGAEGEGEDA